jgi:hypothetical protein
MNKIAIVIPYFGTWPIWIKLYLKSCEENYKIDWYFITDCDTYNFKYKNIFFIKMDFSNYCRIISNKLQINFEPSDPYKLCDLKPFLGFIHFDLIKNYKFWGFADIDIVWGDINFFYSDILLKKYNVFSTHADRISGHFAIFKNNSFYINLAFDIMDWKSKLENPTRIGIDEDDFSYLFFPISKYIRKIYARLMKLLGWRNAWVLYNLILPATGLLYFLRFNKIYFKEQYSTPIVSDDGLTYYHDSHNWFFDQGKIYNERNNLEYMYLHFMFFKKNEFRSFYYWDKPFYKLQEKDLSGSRISISTQGISSLNK